MSSLSFYFLFLFVSLLPSLSFAKSTIEPCSVSDTCPALVGYSLYTDLKVSQVASLFQIDSISLLSANAIDISYTDVENHILPAHLFLNVPLTCSCSEGIRKSVGTRYKTRPSDTLSLIADTVFSGLVSADQIRDANGISDPSVLDVGQTLTIPLPCTCFNGTDNGLPAVYLSYVVRPGDTVAGIAARYSTTVTDVMTVNAMGSTAVKAGDILSIPLPACASSFPKYASDYGLIVANGSYAITGSHCVQCSCGPGNLNLYCMPSPLAVSCSSMQCRNSNLMLGNVTAQPTSAGCNVTTCTYGGFVNGTILTTLSASLQPRCPGVHQFPALVPPPTVLTREEWDAPSPAPSPSDGSITSNPTSPSGSVSTLPGLPPANGPSGSISAASLINPSSKFLSTLCFFFSLRLLV